MEQMRSEFEAWMSDGGKYPYAIEKEKGEYILATARTQWETWQASRAAIEIESVERYSIDCFENLEQDDEGYLVYYDSVINAIRAAGLRVKEQ